LLKKKIDILLFFQRILNIPEEEFFSSFFKEK